MSVKDKAKQQMQKRNSSAVATNDTQKTAVLSFLRQDNLIKRYEEVLKENASSFLSSLTTIVSQDQTLQKCVPATIASSALQAGVLKLPIEKSFGFAYVVPYWNGKKKCFEAQFQMGYKGYIQLALRTGQYSGMNSLAIKEGELKSWDPLREKIELDFIMNAKERTQADTIGFVSYFGLVNGFEKTTFWDVEKMREHAKEYSQNFRKYGNGLWKDDFEGMGIKTALKNLLSKYGILSIDMNDGLSQAIAKDQTVTRDFNNLNEYDYIDNAEETDAEVDDAKEDEMNTHEGEIKPKPEKNSKASKPKVDKNLKEAIEIVAELDEIKDLEELKQYELDNELDLSALKGQEKISIFRKMAEVRNKYDKF